MSMSQKHYATIADKVSSHTVSHILEGTPAPRIVSCVEVRRFAHALADYFEQDNPRFDRERFLEACGVEVTVW